MTEKKFANPSSAGFAGRATPEPCSLVIFGATGDLTHRKLIPALYNLAADGDLPQGMHVIGFARRDKTDGVFRQELEEAAKKFSRRPIDQALWNSFASSIYYHRSEFGDLEGYRRLRERLDGLDKEKGGTGNRLFYLSAGPDQFDTILTNLKASSLAESSGGRGVFRRWRSGRPPGTRRRSRRRWPTRR